ncbi:MULTISPECIES: ATP-binding protein [unclassified Pseudodesulfovibrio]|uniref:AlbA family DNA-binding domain-containing protein n=1 Tax=unclassified Pseudodesulfovibrio TaxID=2661612 RepID=UPI000FEBA05A|nr:MULTISPECIES: ATP-binding protein [unclassified Pseudodesulfovibrio]MCJ2164257.1 ATP-binding protein [Pseudodesulfovibrio sp. S3-i]RWU05120.1 ATP-binding protein [Pseudodesulfovibrio sp. S3]
MKRKRGIRGKELYQVVFFGVIFTVAAIGALAYWGVWEIRRDAAVVAVESSARGLSGAVTVLLNAVRNSNGEIGEGVLSSLEPGDLRKEFQKVFEKHPAVTAAFVSDVQGLQYMLTRRFGGVVEAVPDQNHMNMTWTLYRNGNEQDADFTGWTVDLPQVNRILGEEFAHLEPGQVNWRSSNSFHHAEGAWVTASSLVEAQGGGRLMLSFAFPVDAILSQLGGAEKGGAERIFLYWANGVAMSVNAAGTESVREQGGKPLRSDELSDPVVRTAVTRLATDAPVGPFSYVVEGEIWWAYALPLTIFGDTMSLGVAVPRNNVLSTLTSDSFLQWGAVVLIMVAFGVLFVLHRNRGRIEALGMRREAAVTEQDVLDIISSGEGGRVEFKQTLRFNLKSGKNGREIEHASLKTVSAFINSEGGTLLVGVADDGTVTGFGEDDFDSDDRALLHFNNLVNRHIGTEFSRYIDSAVIEVRGQKVLRVHCIPAPAPAILDSGKSEEFYVRSGPASRILTLKQFYDWLKKH